MHVYRSCSRAVSSSQGMQANTTLPFLHTYSIHRQRFNGRYFEPCSLRDLGLVIDIGHEGDETCTRGPIVKTTLIDSLGIVEISTRLCGCTSHRRPHVQFLRSGWWPASQDRPQTAVTFRCLKLYHAMNLQSKTNPFDFYQSLARLTDSSGLYPPPVCCLTCLILFS